MGVGRPKLEISRSKNVNIRVTDDEFEKIAKVAAKKNLTKTDALLRGIELLEHDKPKKYKSFAKSKTTNEPGVVRGDFDDD